MTVRVTLIARWLILSAETCAKLSTIIVRVLRGLKLSPFRRRL